MAMGKVSSSSSEQTFSFEQFFEKKIAPLIEADNSIKIKQRGRFWASLWTVIFLLSINALIVLYFALMYNRPVNYNQLLMLAIIGILVVCWPIYRYYQYEKVDIFDAFLQFYGTWHHNQNSVQSEIKTAILPSHDNVKVFHDIEGEYCGVKLRIRDVKCVKNVKIKKWNWQRGKAKGVLVDFLFNNDLADKLFLLDKKGFYHKDKVAGMDNIGSRVHIPAANYFYIFNNTENIPDLLKNASFFEQILNIKEVFSARRMYIQIHKNKVRVFLAGSELYLDNYKFWSDVIKQEKFKKLYEQLEEIFTFVETIFIIEKRKS